jgi:hypothetical protein
MHSEEHKSIFTLITAIASSLTFDTTNPFHNSLFVPILIWVTDEKRLIDRLNYLEWNPEDGDLERVWEIMTTNFPRHRKGLKAAYLKLVTQTYRYAGICEPSGQSSEVEHTRLDLSIDNEEDQEDNDEET